MSTFGGEMRLTVNGSPLVMRGSFTLNPANTTSEGAANQDGSIYATFKPAGYRAEVSFEDGRDANGNDVDWNALIRGGPYNVTVIEDFVNVTHTWTQARFVGDPQVDRMTGEVTGISVIAPAYRKS